MQKKKRGRGRPPHDDVLTPTQWRVTHAIQHGITTQGIANGREITRDGVKYHVTQILGKLSLPNRKALRSWFQAPKGSALARQEISMNTLELGPIGQIARTVTDIKRSEQWYREVHRHGDGMEEWMAFFKDPDGRTLAIMSQVKP